MAVGYVGVFPTLLSVSDIVSIFILCFTFSAWVDLDHNTVKSDNVKKVNTGQKKKVRQVYNSHLNHFKVFFF